MKHIVFIVGGFYPNFSAVGNCAYQVINLLKFKFKVSVIALSNKQGLADYEEYEGIYIYRVKTDISKNRNKWDYLIKNESKYYKIPLFLHKVKKYFFNTISKNSIDEKLVSSYLEKLKELQGNVDVIIPCIFPFESLLAAVSYKENGEERTKVFPYVFDNFANSDSLHIFKLNKKIKSSENLKIEKAAFAGVDSILSIHSHSEYFSEIYPGFKKEIIYLEHPLLVKRSDFQISARIKNPKFKCTYTGAFIKGVREPNYFFKLVEIFPQEFIESTIFEFYTLGNCNDTIYSESRKRKDLNNIRAYGEVSREKAFQAMISSNILLNFGEKQGKQISSKIFEYMSFGKPIVHLSYVESDVVTKIISKYPLGLSINQDYERIEENAAIFQNFVLRHAQDNISFDHVCEIFKDALPETTSALISRMVN